MSGPRALDDRPRLRVRRLGIDTHQTPVVYMRDDCAVCRAEGFEAQSQVKLTLGERMILATLNVVHGDWLAGDEAGLSESAWRMLAPRPEDHLVVSHPRPLESFAHVRAKLYGNRLSAGQLDQVIADVVRGRYADVHLAAFVAACAGDRLDEVETIHLTSAMIDSGARLSWGKPLVVDKHSVGGLPGNRTTPIVVAIVAAFGLYMPKTSSRAITSPSGTADAMETMTNVALDLDRLREVVEREGGCLAWGGSVHLSPADDLLIRVERALDIDSEAQLVASILSKKAAAGATHVVIDMPVGATAKVRTPRAANYLSALMVRVGKAIGLQVRVLPGDGSQPVGRGVGPALEAHEVLAVLRRQPGAPADLRARATALAGTLLEIGTDVAAGRGAVLAEAALDDGRAWRKFLAICKAQGGFREPPRAPWRHPVPAPAPGRVAAFDNRRLSRIAKLAGAPQAPAAGLELHHRLGEAVARGEPLYTVHAQTPGELSYALDYLNDRGLGVTLSDGER